MKKITAFTAAALLVTGIGFANAQGTSSPTPDSGSKCWEVSTNTVKDKTPATGAPTTGSSAAGSATSGATAGSTPSGSAGSTAGSAGAGASGSAGAVRPAGMASC